MSSEHFADSRRSLWERYSIVMLEGDTIDARATFSKQNTATKTSLRLGMMGFQRCGIYIWSACEKLWVFTLLSDDIVSIDDDHWEICDISNKDRLVHDKLTHNRGCETGIVEFVVKFRVNDKPAVNARQQVVKRPPVFLECDSPGLAPSVDFIVLFMCLVAGANLLCASLRVHLVFSLSNKERLFTPTQDFSFK